MNQQVDQVQEDDEDSALEAAFAARQERKVVEPEATQADAGTPPASDTAPTAATPEPAKQAEPFEGYSALPEAVRKQYDTAMAAQKASEELTAKLRQQELDNQALRNRLAPVQRQLSELQRSRQNAPAATAQPAKPSALGFDQWLKKQTPERQAELKRFPEEAQAQFEVARDLLESTLGERLKEIESKNEERFTAITMREEVRQIEREHPDWQKYAADTLPDGRMQCRTKEGVDYWNWVLAQGQDIQSAAKGQTAAECAQALSVYKWEKENPGYATAIKDELFEAFLTTRPRAYRDVVRGMDLKDRELIMDEFAEACAEAQRQIESEDPNVAKAKTLADKRQRQVGNVAPSIRANAAPAAAAASSEDADIDAAHQIRQQWLKDKQNR